MGACTVVIRKRDSHGATHFRIADVTFSGSYGAGGDTITAGQFELSTVHAIEDCGVAASATTAYTLLPDLTVGALKLRLIGGAASGVAGAETGTAGQTGTVARVAVYGDNPYI